MRARWEKCNTCGSNQPGSVGNRCIFLGFYFISGPNASPRSIPLPCGIGWTQLDGTNGVVITSRGPDVISRVLFLGPRHGKEVHKYFLGTHAERWVWIFLVFFSVGSRFQTPFDGFRAGVQLVDCWDRREKHGGTLIS